MGNSRSFPIKDENLEGSVSLVDSSGVSSCEVDRGTESMVECTCVSFVLSIVLGVF